MDNSYQNPNQEDISKILDNLKDDFQPPASWQKDNTNLDDTSLLKTKDNFEGKIIDEECLF